MPFVLPNGAVVDPDRVDREMVLSQISERRRLAAQSKNSDRQAQLQSALMAQEMESSRADREQEAALLREQLGQQKEMAKLAESALDKRLTSQFEREQAALRDQNLSVIEEEERLAGGIAKRLNDQLNAIGKPPSDPIKLDEWTKNWSRIRAQIPTNLESALVEEGGRWKINPEYFGLRRARWAKPTNPNAIATALSGGPTDESIYRPMMRNAPPSMAVDPIAAALSGVAKPAPVVPFIPPAQPAPPRAAVGYGGQPGVGGLGGFGMPSPMVGGPIADSRSSIMEALARLFGNARWGAAPMVSPSYPAPFSPQSVGRFDFIAGE